jgi:hypothetical protein
VVFVWDDGFLSLELLALVVEVGLRGRLEGVLGMISPFSLRWYWFPNLGL